MKRVIAILLVMLSVFSFAFAKGDVEKKADDDGLVTITFWYNPAIVEAGSPPDDWFVYDRIRNELGINLVLSPLPSSATDRDVKMNAAGAADAL